MVAGCFEVQNHQVCRSAHCSHLMLRSQTLGCGCMLYTVQALKSCCSPDTDVYHIGLPLLNHYEYDVYVQLSPITSPEVRLLHLNQLQLALAGDPDLALVPPGLRACVVQTLFICSGCDCVLFCRVWESHNNGAFL